MKKILVILGITVLAVNLAFGMGERPSELEEGVEYVEEAQTVPQEKIADEEVAPESTEGYYYQYDSETLEEVPEEQTEEQIPQSEDVDVY